MIDLDKTLTLAIPVRNRHQSAVWYEEKLGFSLIFHGDDVGWSEMATPLAGLHIGLSDHADSSAEGIVPVIGVADLEVARSGLEASGVQFDGETETIEGMVSTARFFDPDRNILMLAQDLS